LGRNQRRKGITFSLSRNVRIPSSATVRFYSVLLFTGLRVGDAETKRNGRSGPRDRGPGVDILVDQ
jgi:hypothetical protein